MSNFRNLFKNHDFASLWVGQFISAIGDRFTQMSLLTIVLAAAADSVEKMAWITFYSLLPFLLLGQLFGVVSDKVSRKKVMIISDIIRAILVACMPLVSKCTNSFGYICFLVFCVGVLSALFSPAKMAMVPMIVQKHQLIAANSLITSTGMIATLLGTLIAGFLIKAIGPYPSLYIDAATYIISAIMIAKIMLKSCAQAASKISLHNLYDGIKQGLSFIKRHKSVGQIVQLNAFFSLLSSFFYITILHYGTAVLALGSEGYGILFACLGVGLCLGAFVLGKTKGNLSYRRVLILGFLSISVVNLLFTFNPPFAISLIILVLGGIGAAFISIPLDSLLQRATPNAIRANVFGARGIVTNAVFLISVIFVGKILTLSGCAYVFCLMGIVSFAVGVVLYVREESCRYRIVRGIIRFLLRTLCHLKIEGIENIPAQGKVILAGNHTSLLDGVIVMAACPRRVYFLAAESVFKRRFYGPIARALGFIPVKKNTVNKDAVKESLRILKSHNVLGVFPEGKVTETEDLADGKKGTAVIAMKTKTIIVPFAIEGAYYAWPEPQKYPKIHPIEIKFGAPLYAQEYETPQQLTEIMMDTIRQMKLAEERQGWREADINAIVRHIIYRVR